MDVIVTFWMLREEYHQLKPEEVEAIGKEIQEIVRDHLKCVGYSRLMRAMVKWQAFEEAEGAPDVTVEILLRRGIDEDQKAALAVKILDYLRGPSMRLGEPTVFIREDLNSQYYCIDSPAEVFREGHERL